MRWSTGARAQGRGGGRSMPRTGRKPADRIGQPVEVRELIVCLVRAEEGFITGAVLDVALGIRRTLGLRLPG